MILVNKGNYYNESNAENTTYSNLKKEIITTDHKIMRNTNIDNKLGDFLTDHPNALIELITQSESFASGIDSLVLCYSFTMIIFYREPV